MLAETLQPLSLCLIILHVLITGLTSLTSLISLGGHGHALL